MMDVIVDTVIKSEEDVEVEKIEETQTQSIMKVHPPQLGNPGRMKTPDPPPLLLQHFHHQRPHPPPPPAREYAAHFKGIMMEHCYARPYNWRSEANFLRPTKTLFINRSTVSRRRPSNPLAPLQDPEDLIDVESLPTENPVIYDTAKVKVLMEECERHAAYAREDGDIGDDWEEKVVRTNWTPGQNHLFNVMVNMLHSDRMARLAYEGVHNEAILRRTVIEKSVKRFRQLMAKYSWDTKLAQWMHQLLIDNLSAQYLTIYFDILQTLRHKVPLFVDKLLYGPGSHNRVGAVSNESLYPLMKRTWDPVAASLSQDKPKKLPGNPVIILVPSAPSVSAPMYSKRLHRWINLFTNLGTVFTVYNNIGSSGHKLTMMNCVDQMFAATRAKIQEIKAEFPTRPIILAGFNAGSALALQVAQVETVLCILCLGFSIHTAEGNRGEPDDNLLELQCPVLFVIGQCSNTVLQEHMEDIRERMRVETGLLVVGGGDDHLRVNKKKKRSEGITQSIVDRCIIDEIGEFISGLLLSPYPPQIRQSPAHIPTDIMKRPKIERKRNNSNGSSLDSEPPSPTPRISRPGQTSSPVLGRPPGSKSKSKIEAKWHAMQQGTSNSTSSTETADTASSNNSDERQQPDNGVVKPASNPQPAAKLQALGITPGRNMYHGSTLSSLLQGGVRTLPPNPPGKQIKVLENLTISSSSSSTGKMMAVPGRTIDMNKMTVVNPGTKVGAYGNVMLMSDGKIKPGPPMRSLGNQQIILQKTKVSTTTPPTTTTTAKTSLTKYITSKKQLLANRNKPMKKLPFTSAPLPPPTNLTSQDIMDLPIIFADDNQMLSNNTIQPSDTPSAQFIQTQVKAGSCGKLVFLNKQSMMKQQNVLKRPGTPMTKVNPIKYAKIILSKAPTPEEMKKPSTPKPPQCVSINVKESDDLMSTEGIDLENELVATAITKPNFVPPMVYKMSSASSDVVKDFTKKITKLDLDADDDSDDPEYVPSKNE